MRLPKIHDVAFSSKFIPIENADDVPAIAKELYKAFGFVQPKVSEVEFKRLIALVKALTAPMYFPLYPKRVLVMNSLFGLRPKTPRGTFFAILGITSLMLPTCHAAVGDVK